MSRLGTVVRAGSPAGLGLPRLATMSPGGDRCKVVRLVRVDCLTLCAKDCRRSSDPRLGRKLIVAAGYRCPTGSSDADITLGVRDLGLAAVEPVGQLARILR
ncbi:hypothetical protein [Kibdelosporangium philippinense]|uniref:hypothetical protein n=1 Tax=Kibdelosporangium philippinense TaxID=211113 RepID=UPI003617FA26